MFHDYFDQVSESLMEQLSNDREPVLYNVSHNRKPRTN